MPEDAYSSIDYSRFVDWPARLEREWPFLRKVLDSAPSRRILDLGCGSGEHARFLAKRGFSVLGVDASGGMLARARDAVACEGVEFVAGDIASIATLTSMMFGAALCLGNTLPHLRDDSTLSRFLTGLRARLLPGAPILIQVLNYERILGQRVRFLPLSFLEDGGEEIVFLRLMQPLPDGTVIFTPTTLRYRRRGEPSIEVVATRNIVLRGWTGPELKDALARAAFHDQATYGTIGESPYSREHSNDFVIVAR